MGLAWQHGPLAVTSVGSSPAPTRNRAVPGDMVQHPKPLEMRYPAALSD